MLKDDPNLNDNETAYCHKSFVRLFLTRFITFKKTGGRISTQRKKKISIDRWVVRCQFIPMLISLSKNVRKIKV